MKHTYNESIRRGTVTTDLFLFLTLTNRESQGIEELSARDTRVDATAKTKTTNKIHAYKHSYIVGCD
jgi:hypothetical protein